jgi:hypothetical protein
MKFTELDLKKDGYNFNCNTYKSGSHYKFIMRLGRCFPSTKAQAKYFISQGVCLDVLNYDDVETIESILNKHGFQGDYKFTKSKTWVRLQNNIDLHRALKLEFSI